MVRHAKKVNRLFIKSFSRLLLARKIRPAVTVINIHSLCMKYSSVPVVVNFLSQVIFVFLLFLGMLMYANEVKTKGKIKIT